jgi:hypothetical protein
MSSHASRHRRGYTDAEIRYMEREIQKEKERKQRRKDGYSDVTMPRSASTVRPSVPPTDFGGSTRPGRQPSSAVGFPGGARVSTASREFSTSHFCLFSSPMLKIARATPTVPSASRPRAAKVAESIRARLRTSPEAKAKASIIRLRARMHPGFPWASFQNGLSHLLSRFPQSLLIRGSRMTDNRSVSKAMSTFRKGESCLPATPKAVVTHKRRANPVRRHLDNLGRAARKYGRTILPVTMRIM